MIKFLKRLFTYNIFLKIISLVLAIIVWILISSEITKGIRI